MSTRGLPAAPGSESKEAPASTTGDRAVPTSSVDPARTPFPWPDHLTLPETDGTVVTNAQEHPLNVVLTTSILPVLDRLHPDGRYAVCMDVGIYYQDTYPNVLDGCKAPDWFYVPDVDPLIDGQVRRSFVLWRELIAPLLLIEYASGDGSEERNRTPYKGKFWVYEHVIRPAFYAIFEREQRSVEVYHLVENRFEPLPANERGHYPIKPMGVELGVWQGRVMHMDLPWLRFWDAEGNLLLTADERSERDRQRAERLAAYLRSLGRDPDAIP